MPALSRRLFLKRGSLTVAAAGVLSAFPGVPALLSTAESDAPGTGAAAGEAASAGSADAASAGNLAQPLVAHVKDLSTGEISLYLGENEYRYRDPELAARLFRAAR